jgi:DNA-binding XRE family transcriptional regulator
MEHNEVLNELLENPELKKEYDKLETQYLIKKKIISLRLEKGMTQKQLAEKIGTKQAAISRLETDDYNPSIDFLSKVANALGKELEINFI